MATPLLVDIEKFHCSRNRLTLQKTALFNEQINYDHISISLYKLNLNLVIVYGGMLPSPGSTVSITSNYVYLSLSQDSRLTVVKKLAVIPKRPKSSCRNQRKLFN